MYDMNSHKVNTIQSLIHLTSFLFSFFIFFLYYCHNCYCCYFSLLLFLSFSLSLSLVFLLFVCALFSQCKSNVTQCKEIENVHFNPINVFGLMHVLLLESVWVWMCAVHVCVQYMYVSVYCTCVCVCALYVHIANITQSIAECAPLWQRKRSHNQPVDDSTYPAPSPLWPPHTPPSPPFCYCDLSHFDRRLLRRDCCMTNCSQLWQNVARTTTISLFPFFFFGQDGSHKKMQEKPNSTWK